jgi:hypothetical protein
MVLARLGRVTHDQHLKPWHGNVLLDDSTSRAIAFRIKLVREALYMDASQFFRSCGIDQEVGEALEAGYVTSLCPDQELLQAICVHYDIPEEWIMHGAAEEIEA